MKIIELYAKWTEETIGDIAEEPFTKLSEWRGDMVEGFVKFCLKEYSQTK